MARAHPQLCRIPDAVALADAQHMGFSHSLLAEFTGSHLTSNIKCKSKELWVVRRKLWMRDPQLG